jgi:spore maturation protein SpmA
MTLNGIWIGMIVIGAIVALVKVIFWQDTTLISRMVQDLFQSAETGFTISIGMTAMITFWLGIMKIGENAGAIQKLTRLVAPLFKRLFPEVPSDHPATGAMMMNFSANMLGLDNAATPLGLKAMKELQELNPEKETASNAQIMFLVLNTSGLTIIPVSVFAILASNGDKAPTSVFLPILIATFFASLAGLILVGLKQRINLLNKVVLAYLGGLTALICGLLYWVTAKPEAGEMLSSVIGNGLILLIIVVFVLLGFRKKIGVYESFIEGAKDGFNVAIGIIPYLIAMLAAITFFRSSGTLQAVLDGVQFMITSFGVVTTEWVDALPVAFMKPLSGSGARAALVDVIQLHGVDSLQARIATVMQGSTETTFYVLAVYFGAVKIKNTRYAAGIGLLADFVGLTAAVFVSYIFFSHA